MSEELDRRLDQLRKELDALQQIKTQEDFDEGARLHNAKNAPWVAGMYSHLEFAPYQYREFPRAVYTIGFEAARIERAAAETIPAHGVNDVERQTAILQAERKMAETCRTVHSVREWQALGPAWFASPTEAVEYERKLQREMAEADAHRAFTDRRMTGRAAEERDAAEEGADNFVPEIKEQRRRPSTRKKSVPAVQA